MAEGPLVDRSALENQFNSVEVPQTSPDLPNVEFRGLDNPMPRTSGNRDAPVSSLTAIENSLFSKKPSDGKMTGGSIQRSLSELSSPRYDNFVPGDYNNEDAYAQGQGWTEKMVNSVGKGLLLTGTTFLQSTVGMVNGLVRWGADGRAASFYDNDLNRWVDDVNKKAEDIAPNYYTDVEKNARWYSPTKLFSANFLWDGIVKNLGFAAGAALSGGAFAAGLKAIPLTARLFSVGKAAEALAATEQGLLGASKVADTYGKIKSLSDKFISSYNVLNPGGRALVAGLATTGEAGFEAFQNLNEFREQKIREFKENNFGQEPQGADLAEINQTADSVGNASFLANVGILSATNYIQFPKILGSTYTAEKGAINSLSKEIKDIATIGVGEYAEQASKKGFAKVLSGLDTVRKYSFSGTEAFEEGSQFAISKGVNDYYDKKYKGDATDFLESLSQGITQTLGTDEGMENVLIGGLSGAIMTAKGRFKESSEKALNTVDAIQKFNKFKLSDFTKETIDSVNRGTILQEEREGLLKEGDIAGSKDKETDYIINYLSPRIKYGRYDLVMSDIADYRALASTEEGFAQLRADGKVLEEDNREAYLKRISSLEQTAGNVKSLYQSLNLRYGNLVDKEGKQIYSSEVMDKMVYAASKVADYDVRIPQLSNSLNAAGVINTNTIIQDLLNGDDSEYNKTIAELTDSKELSAESSLQNLKDLARASALRKEFLDEYDKIKKSPFDFKNIETEEETETVPKETITIKTKTGEKEIELGVEYFLGRTVGKDNDGKPVYFAPRLTVLRENEDGTIAVKTSKGTRNISKDELESYQLGKVSSTLANKKAKFFMENWNTEFQHYGRKNKDGTPAKGRLEYNDKNRILTFVYVRNGIEKSEEITGDQFVAQKNYKYPIITPVGVLTKVQEDSLAGLAEDAKTDPRVAAKGAERLRILSELFDELTAKQAKSIALIERKQKQIEKIKQDLIALEEESANAEANNKPKKSVKFKATAKKALANAVSLSRTQEQLEDQILKLENDSEEIEFNLSYVSELLSNIDQLPTSGTDLIDELKENITDLKTLQETNNTQISTTKDLIKETEKAINGFIDFISSLIEKFEAKFPDAPRIMGQEYKDFLKANPNFLKLNPNYKEELSELEDLISTVEEKDIAPSQTKIDNLKESLSVMETDTQKLQTEINSKSIVLKKFEKVAKEYKKQKEEDAKFQRNEALIQQFIGTLGGYTQTQMKDDSYEVSAKKGNTEVVTSGMGASGEVQESRPFNARLGRFAFNFNKLPNKDSVRAVVVTKKTENKIIKGLTDHLMQDATPEQKAKYKTDEIIVLVLTDEDGNPIDENGVTIPKGTKPEVLLNTAIYQTFPTEELKAMYDGVEESMFRKGTKPEVEASLREQYKAWRTSMLAQSDLPKPVSVTRSFGIADYVKIKNEKGKDVIDYSTRNSVVKSGLISADDLLETQTITVATTNDSISFGHTAFDTPLGGVFLQAKDGLYKLFNRKFNEKEATTIYDVILQLAKNGTRGEKLSSDSMDLINWLKSTIYWGINKTQEGERKDPGYNSVWFETITEEGKKVTRLFISAKEKDSTKQFEFTPAGLESKKDDIILLLTQLYSNTDAKLVNNTSAYNNKYSQITGIDAEGKPIATKWPNYQSYLLSDKTPDGSPREIPLTTPIRELKGEDDINKRGFYFTLDTASEFEIPSAAPSIIPEVPSILETPPIPAVPAAAPAAPQVFDFEGGENIIPIGEFGEASFTLDAKLYIETDGDEGFGFNASADVVARVVTKLGITPEEAKKQIAIGIVKKFKPQLEAYKAELEAPTQEEIAEVVEAAPIATPVTEEETQANDDIASEMIARAKNLAPRDNEANRIKIEQEISDFKPESWDAIEAFIKKVLPNIPFYRVKNILQATNGRQAWGMFKNGAIYVYENAEVGTAYHEVFEAVWKMFSDPKEKKAIINEFKNRKGSFVDRETQQVVAYKDVTSAQLKEQLAEEFRDFVLTGKHTELNKSKSFIGRLFTDIVNFIKSFFTGENAANNTEQLFEKIASGYYAKYNPYESKLSYANKGIIDIDTAEGEEGAEFRVTAIPAQQVIDIVEDMTYNTVSTLSKSNQDLAAAINPTSKQELLSRLKEEVLNRISEQYLIAKSIKEDDSSTKDEKEKATVVMANKASLYANVKIDWEKVLVKRYEEKLKTLSIEFDENDSIALLDFEKGKDEGFGDARKIDSFRKSNAIIKLLFGTLARTIVTKEGKIELDPSTIGGAQLIPSDKVFITLKNALYDSLTVDDMLRKLKAIGETNSDYAVLYKRITKNDINSRVLDFDKLQDYDLDLISGFWKAMKGQNADVLSVFTLPNGQVVIGDSNLSQASRQAKRELSNNLIANIKTDNPYIKYNPKTGKYNAATNADGNKVINSDDLAASNTNSYITFLDKIGMPLTTRGKDGSINLVSEVELKRALSINQMKAFKSAVEGIKESLSKVSNVASLSTKTLSIDGTTLVIGATQSIIQYPEFESTYFNVNGERTQTYLGTNALSELYATLKSIKNIRELENTNYAYLLTDVFSKGDASVLLNKMFNVATTGNRKEGTEELLHPVYIDGTIDEKKNKKTESSRLTIKQRIIQEINLNLSGVFMNLIPGDASIEWAIRMFEKESPIVTKEDFKDKDYLNIFKNYFISEVELAKEGRTTAKKKNSGELRFFKDILGEDYKTVWNAQSKELDPQEVYAEHEEIINKAVARFIAAEAADTRDLLDVYGITKLTNEGIAIEDLALTESETITEEELTEKLNLLSVNYIIANIEMHKLIYSDPYQYKDELKRIKNFLSPRQPLLAGSGALNAAFNKQYNKFFDKDDIGYSNMTTEIFKSSVVADVLSTDELPGYEDPFEETDGGGLILLKSNRIFGIRSGSWTPANEMQYRYDIAYEKTVKGENLTEDEKAKKGLTITQEEKTFNIKKIVDDKGNVRYVGNNPNVKSTYTTRKPIVSGSKADGKNYNDIVLDKFALTPLSFRVLHELNPTSNAIKLYNKMQSEGVDYVVYNSGRKVGAGVATPLYNVDGSFNTNSFEEINNIPFSIMGVQSEVPSKEESIVTQGSQITKLVTLDFLEAGMPIDFMPEEKDFNKRYIQWIDLKDKTSYKDGDNLYKEILNNQELLQAKLIQGYETLLTKLGITESTNNEGKKTFEIANVDKLIDTLTDEILKREVNENIIRAFEQFKENKGIILEATPAYQQIRNILYSIADKNVVSPKISGGSKVQVSSALLESVRAEGKEVTDEEGVTRTVYGSTDLKFYRNNKGERVCQIMIGRWFKSDMSDKDLLEYLNKTDEGKKILRGVAFRIPTQKQNSIDVFEIKRFLPESFSDNVIIPSALVKKVGSDFDIDKLSIYLKNIFTDGRGNLKIVPYLGIGKEAKAKFGQMFDRGEFLTENQIKDLDRYVAETKERELDNTTAEYKLMRDIFPEAFSDEALEKEYITDLVSTLSKNGVRETIIEDMYKKSLENEYIQSLENIVSHPLNFDNLVKPNSAKELNDLSKDIVKLTKQKEIDYSSVGNMLNRRFMSELRQDFVSGKYAIGIAATAQTNHAESQRSSITIDRNKLANVSEVDKEWLGDAIINLPHNSISGSASLSMINNVEGKSISDIIGQFIDGFVDIAKGPWIMKLGATPNVAGTWLFLTKVGVPIRTTAYFMNQPIIRDYLRNIQSDGYSYLFMDQYVENVEKSYPTKKSVKATFMPSETELENMLGKTGKELSPLQNAQQGFILKEFLKYAKMAEHLFKVQQATNFDTATLNDPFLIFKKKVQLERAKNTIISDVDVLVKNSFKNVLKDRIFEIRDAFAEILLSDKKGRIRNLMESVLLPYIDKSDRDFIKISQTAVNTLFDWAMLNAKDRSYSKTIVKTLLGTSTEKSAALQIIDFRNAVISNPNHPLRFNIVLNAIKMEPGTKVGKPDTLYIAGRDNKVYDQNLIIDAFREIKENLGTENKDLYGKLVRVAILQSGLTVSPISFTSLLPYEDFNEVYNVALSDLENMSNLGDFQKLNVFERTNWSNTNVVPFKTATLRPRLTGGSININEVFIDDNLKAAMYNGEISKVINISTKSLEGRSDFITYSWQSDVIFDSEKGEFVILTKKLKAEARQKGDYSYVKKGLFKRVYVDRDGVRVPLTQVNEKGYVNYVYKMINAWGDSYRANESYDYIRMSVLDNGYERLEAAMDDSGKQIRAGESTDDEIVAALNADTETETTPSTQPSGSVESTDSGNYTFDSSGILQYKNKELDNLFLKLRDEYKIPSIPKTKEETRLFRLKNALLLTKDADTADYIKIPDLSNIFTNPAALNLYNQYLYNINNSRELFIERFKNDPLYNQEISFRPGEIKKGYEFIPKTTKALIEEPSILFMELFKKAGLIPGTDKHKAKLLELKQFVDSKTTSVLNNAIKLELGINPTQPSGSTETDVKRRRAEDNKKPSRQSVKYKLQNKIAGIDNPTIGNEVANLSDAIKIAGNKITTPIKINEGEITHIVFDQGESNFEFTYKGKKFAAFYIPNVKGNTRWEITKIDPKSNTYKYISLDELKNINEKYGSQKDLLISIGIKDLVTDIENFEKVEYTTEDKSYGIIPLENAVSAEQIKLGKKYGVSYTLEDFIKDYDAELASLDTAQPSTSLSPEEIKDIQTKIVRIETAIENGVADPQQYKDLDAYREQLGLSPSYELTSANFEAPRPEGITQEEWDALSQEEKNKINEC